MHSYVCMLCKKEDVYLANIYLKNGRNNSSSDNMVDLYGTEIEQRLKCDDLICVNCIQVLENVVKLKQQIYEIIVDHEISRETLGIPGTKVFNLSKAWNSHLNNVTPSYLSYEGSGHSASPNDLLVISSSIPYDQRSDTDMEIANSKYRNYDSDSAMLDREIQEMTFRGRRRVRGHKWTRRKGSQRSRNQSRAFSSRANSRISRSSTTSKLSRATTSNKRHKSQKNSEVSQVHRILGDLLSQNDSLSDFTKVFIKDNLHISDLFGSTQTENGKSNVKTRFASELRSKVLSQYQKVVYECPTNGCHVTMYSLEAITDHRVKEHNEMALFACEQCHFTYLSQEHLDKHRETHFGKFIQYCIYCAEEYTNKKLYEEHLNEHLLHSFPCIYCDKFFLTKEICDKHIREQHPGRKRKMKRKKPQSILDRIDKNPEESKLNSQYPKRNRKKSEEFVVRILWQHGRPEESSTAEEDLEDTSVDLNELEMISVEGNE